MSCEDHSLLESFMDVYENLHGLGPSKGYRLFALLSCFDCANSCSLPADFIVMSGISW